MPAYHSTFLAESAPNVGNMALLPLRTKFRGPAYTTDQYDIVDETLDLFRANSLFRNFEIKGPADRTLIYGILFVSDCLNAIKPNVTEREAQRLLSNVALDHFSIPGEPGFPLNSMYSPPQDRSEAETLQQYIQQFRQELATRLVQRLYDGDGAVPNKHWLAFSKHRFMNKKL
ncbi:hypothetical protein CANCADRAFT_1620 [Tortispora caseinolytica NRRL Y-17796]|uniref:Actin-related protein 2/3 complex subunit 3 n=1 Tax=Tortispora caseinolytica NRRL Y-17796 TaxID=767744 RepID=A0A1E4TDP2_9ASCO|nr:hypothetical protein CANCADRAFT_1620 [Tortispora caseinolytica NRRL Y-17796]